MNKKLMRELGFDKEVNRILKGECPWCAKLIKDESFINERSRRENEISGLCQTCQDGFFQVGK